MDIEKAQALKAETESKIAKLILDFQNESGLSITHAFVKFVDVSTPESTRNQVSSVELAILL